MKRYGKWRWLFIRIKTALIGNSFARAKYLKQLDVFKEIGDDFFYASRKIPTEPYLVKIHNNVHVAANVTMITHDIINDMLRIKDGYDYSEYFMGTIEIMDNVMIGMNSTIMYNTKIGPNAIVAAGSVVTKDVPEGTIVGGNPARVIGRLNDLIEKRKEMNLMPSNREKLEVLDTYFWESSDE